jgi:hypothetical protein
MLTFSCLSIRLSFIISDTGLRLLEMLLVISLFECSTECTVVKKICSIVWTKISWLWIYVFFFKKDYSLA